MRKGQESLELTTRARLAADRSDRILRWRDGASSDSWFQLAGEDARMTAELEAGEKKEFLPDRVVEPGCGAGGI
jgi:hypothetical protein